MSRAPRTTTTRHKVESRPADAAKVSSLPDGVAKTDPELALELTDPNTKILYKRGKFLGKVCHAYFRELFANLCSHMKCPDQHQTQNRFVSANKVQMEYRKLITMCCYTWHGL